MSNISREKTRWGLHSIVTIDGSPYCVFQEWELWRYKTRKNTGGRSICTIPSGNIKMEKLTEALDGDSVTNITAEIL